MTTLMQGLIHAGGHSLAYGLVHALGWTLLHFCWQGTLVAGVLWCVLGLLGGRSSQARYGATCWALVLIVIAPMMTFARLATDEYRLVQGNAGAAVAIDPGMILWVGAGEPGASWPMRAVMTLDRAVPWVLLLWVAGVALYAGRLNLGLIVAHRMKTTDTHAPPDELLRMFERLRQSLGIARAVRLMHSARVQVPTVIGWLRPVVLIPVSCLTGLTAEQIEAILCHELAHVIRHDYLVSVFQSVVEALLFYHPAVWWVSKQVRRERECCCDELAVQVSGDVLAYARALSYLEERRAGSPEFVLGANGGVLTMRIQRLLGHTENPAGAQMVSIALLATLVAAGSAAIGGLAYAQGGAVQSKPPVSNPSQNAAGSVATSLGPAENSARQSGDAGRPQLPTTEQQRDLDNERRLGDVSTETQEVRDRLAQLDKMKPDVTKQIEDAKRQLEALDQLQNLELRKLLNDALGKHAGVAMTFSPEAQKQMEEAQRSAKKAMERLNSPDFRKQLEQASAAAAKVDTPEFRKQLEDALKVQIDTRALQQEIRSKLNRPDIQKLMDEAMAATSKINSPELRKALDEAMRATKDVNTPTFKHQLDLLLAQNAIVAKELSAPLDRQTDASKPIGIASGVMAGNVISKVDPVYPAEAKTAGVQGAVVLRAVISKTGTVGNLQVVSGPKELTGSAIDAVKQWRYKPYLLNGEPVEVETTITVNYSLEGSGESQGKLGGGGDVTGVRKIGGGVSAPLVIYQVDPEYTAEAKAAKFSAVVLVNLIVDTNGLPRNVHVVRAVGEGLDIKAVEAVKQYRFKPAMEDGKAVPVDLNIEVNFRIF